MTNSQDLHCNSTCTCIASQTSYKIRKLKFEFYSRNNDTNALLYYHTAVKIHQDTTNKYRSLWTQDLCFIFITNSGSPFTVTHSHTKKKWKYSVIQLKYQYKFWHNIKACPFWPLLCKINSSTWSKI